MTNYFMIYFSYFVQIAHIYFELAEEISNIIFSLLVFMNKLLRNNGKIFYLKP